MLSVAANLANKIQLKICEKKYSLVLGADLLSFIDFETGVVTNM